MSHTIFWIFYAFLCLKVKFRWKWGLRMNWLALKLILNLFFHQIRVTSADSWQLYDVKLVQLRSYNLVDYGARLHPWLPKIIQTMSLVLEALVLFKAWERSHRRISVSLGILCKKNFLLFVHYLNPKYCMHTCKKGFGKRSFRRCISWLFAWRCWGRGSCRRKNLAGKNFLRRMVDYYNFNNLFLHWSCQSRPPLRRKLID